MSLFDRTPHLSERAQSGTDKPTYTLISVGGVLTMAIIAINETVGFPCLACGGTGTSIEWNSDKTIPLRPGTCAMCGGSGEMPTMF